MGGRANEERAGDVGRFSRRQRDQGGIWGKECFHLELRSMIHQLALKQ